MCQLTFDWECFFRYPAYQQQLHHRSPYLLWTQPGRTTETQCRGKSRRAVACERKIWRDDDRWQLRPVKKIVLRLVQIDGDDWCLGAQIKWKSCSSISFLRFLSSSFRTQHQKIFVEWKIDFLTVKSCGVPGLIVGFRGRPSWCEWINVSSRSSTRVFRCTKLKRCRDTANTKIIFSS